MTAVTAVFAVDRTGIHGSPMGIAQGRKTRKRRETVAMALTYDPGTREAIVCSAWGLNTEWIRNLRAHPLPVEVELGDEVGVRPPRLRRARLATGYLRPCSSRIFQLDPRAAGMGLSFEPNEQPGPHIRGSSGRDPGVGENYRVVFARRPVRGGTAMRLLIEVMSLQERPDVRDPRLLATCAFTAAVATLAGRRLRMRR